MWIWTALARLSGSMPGKSASMVTSGHFDSALLLKTAVVLVTTPHCDVALCNAALHSDVRCTITLSKHHHLL